MDRLKWQLDCAARAAAAFVMLAAGPGQAATPADEQPYSLSLKDSGGTGKTGDFPWALAAFQETSETTIVRTETSGGDEFSLSGPYFLRSADPEEPGDLDLKLVYGYSTSSGESDDHEANFVLEWGMAENWELILEAEVELGEGRVEGNGDITEFGFHTKLWDETDWLPAFAVRNLIRIPTGYHSSGVDYQLRGLFTKTIVPGSLRGHFNPYLKVISGDNEEEARPFQWGAALGVDFVVNEDLFFIADYHHRVSEEEGFRNNHSLELGMDWEFAEHQTLGLATEFSLDGDTSGPNWGFNVSYILELGVGRLDGP